MITLKGGANSRHHREGRDVINCPEGDNSTHSPRGHLRRADPNTEHVRSDCVKNKNEKRKVQILPTVSPYTWPMMLGSDSPIEQDDKRLA